MAVFWFLDLDYHYGNYSSEDALSTVGSLIADPKNSPHLRISFEDESSRTLGKAKFTVTCYFAKEFDALRRKCCPSEVDFVRSLSRCKRWSAQGGKSNVYFAKSFDERFIIKQVTKTELESFDEFAPEYFKYLTDALSSGSPTCLAKVLGIYQVSVKHAKTAKETKMDLMLMENLSFKRSISKVYDLKGSARSRYNSDTTGANKVLLDMNLLETLHTDPIFLGSKAKRRLERAVWNDTSFLASVDVMDYSLLVGVDEERKELVLGIIDYMRQYTWDKHLETWVKASGILGGPKNASPTIISPKQYKKRFRKAMTTYFLTVPDQWSS
ncbi:UNVERIFIED_CONTAM: putative 1-phosphatidylinositol-3-phosphate 5-kinase FAB1C [Sesamum calycinum]|uniref:1-phosphatidylinositol-3-phosphate 5-kinase FAB1C n=1 Tax=Sesamum calycinum TaxID=2727403 RepID=A0AAW2QZD8_9LAMI